MLSFFRRLFRIGKAEANSALDKMENPIKMTKQGIRDLKGDLDESLKSLAEVKAIAIRTRREASQQKQLAADYEKKAMALLKRGQSGAMEMSEAERLATEAMARKGETMKLYKQSFANQEKYDAMVSKMEGKVRSLKSQIGKWENELRSLEARSKVSKATKKLNKQMSSIDASGTVSMLERMRDKVAEEEALAESYGELADIEKSVDAEIDKALDDSSLTASEDLMALKRKMGMLPAEEEKGTPIELKEKRDVTIKIELDDKSDDDKA